jgi:hypothetical protein
MKTMTEAEWAATHSDFANIWTIERTDWPNWADVREKYMGKRTIMDNGALLVEGMGLTITPNPPTISRPVYLRTIARALEKAILTQPESSLHWVSVVGEDSIAPTPTKEWVYDDALIQVGVVNGNSEGCLVYVHAQKGRYEPDKLTALFRIKLLCSAKRAFGEAKLIYEFFESEEFTKAYWQDR